VPAARAGHPTPELKRRKEGKGEDIKRRCEGETAYYILVQLKTAED
jgi:hypothetical protein